MGYTSQLDFSYVEVGLSPELMGTYTNDTGTPVQINSVTLRIGVGASGITYNAGNSVYCTGSPIAVRITCNGASTNYYTTSKTVGYGGSSTYRYPLRSDCESVTLKFNSPVVVGIGSSVTLNIEWTGTSGALVVDSKKETVNVSAYNPITYYTVAYNANGGSNPPAAQTKASNANLTLTTSKPTAPRVALSFNANGGSVSTASKSYNKSFSVWNTNAAGTGTNYNPGGTFKTNANTTLYAIWAPATVGELPTPTKSGNVFLGWFTATSGGTQVVNGNQLSSNTTVYARWQSIYTISYNANGGSGAPGAQTKYHGVDLTLTSSKPTTNKQITVTLNPSGGSVSPSSVKLDAAFVRWNTNAAGSGTNYNSGSVYRANADATLYAQWSNPALGTPPVPSRSGCIFVDWYTATNGGSIVTSTASFKDNTTIYARWNYIITYDLNGGHVGDSLETSIPDDIKKHQVNLALTGIRPSKENLTFLGWSESKTATSATYAPGGTYSKNEPKTLYAVYGLPSYTVTFDLNGGINIGGSALVQTVKHGENAVLPNNPVKPGRVFKGWIGDANNITKDTVITALWNGSPLWILRFDRRWASYVD